MRGGYCLTPRARAGLLRIVLRAEQSFGAEVAEGVISELERAFELIAQHPRLDVSYQGGSVLARSPDIPTNLHELERADMKCFAAMIMLVVLSNGFLLADIVDCGGVGQSRPYQYEFPRLYTGYWCEPSDALNEMEAILTTLGANASPDICSECDPPQTGCIRLGHTDPGPGIDYGYEHRSNPACSGDQMEHRLWLEMPAPKHYISCTPCS